MKNARSVVVFGITALALLAGVGLVAAQDHLDRPAPEFVGSTWLNTPKNAPLALGSRKGKVTIVHFWTFGCINCKRNLPAYGRWQKQFEKRDVAVVGVHTPEFDWERDPANVAREAGKLGVTHPILLDKKGENWNRWQQQYWPTVYLIDKRGRVRYVWAGELEHGGMGGEAKMARLVEALLREKVGG